MKKTRRVAEERLVYVDTMRPEYDFSRAVRGKTAARFWKGTNVVLLDPDVHELFPDSESVNSALRAYAKLAPRRQKRRSKA